MNEYWVMKVSFRDGTVYQGVTKYRPSGRKARQELLRGLKEIYPDWRIRQKGGGIMRIFVGTEKESEFSRTGHKDEKSSTTSRLSSDKNLHVKPKTKRCRQS